MCDVFKDKSTDSVKSFVSQWNAKMVPVPNNWTSYFQPLNTSINKLCKDFLRNEALTWYPAKIVEKMKEGKRPHEIKVGTHLTAVKPLHEKWITKLFDYICSKPDILHNGWEKSQMTQHINQEIVVGPFKNV